jgi:hypothetical protein
MINPVDLFGAEANYDNLIKYGIEKKPNTDYLESITISGSVYNALIVPAGVLFYIK